MRIGQVTWDEALKKLKQNLKEERSASLLRESSGAVQAWMRRIEAEDRELARRFGYPNSK